MFRFVSEPTTINFTVGEGVRTCYVSNPGCPSSTTEQSFPPTTADSSLERKEVLSSKHYFEQQLETSIVDKKFGDFQWDFSSQTGFTSCAPDGYFIDWLGCSSPGKINRRNMVISKNKMAYQQVGTTISKASLPNIFQESKVYLIHIQMHNSGFDIFEKYGGNQESENYYTVKRDLGDLNFETNHDYCGVPAQLNR